MKIQEKIKTGKNKVAGWCADNIMGIMMCTGMIVAGVTGFAFGYGTRMESESFIPKRNKEIIEARIQGATILEAGIRHNVPQAAELIDKHLEGGGSLLSKPKE